MMPRVAGVRTVGGLFLPALSVLIASRVMPTCHLGPTAAGLVVYVGATLPAICAVALMLRDPLQPLFLAPIGVALVLLAVPAKGVLAATLVAAGLSALGAGLGGAIGRRVQRPGHLLPAAAMAAAADIVSVTASFGPSRAIAESPRALALLAVSFPVPGTHEFAPALGVGDLVFSALALGVAGAHELPYIRTAFAAYVGVLLAGGLSLLLAAPVPALPLIGAAIVAAVPATRVIHRRDQTATRTAIGLAMVALLFAVVRAKMARP